MDGIWFVLGFTSLAIAWDIGARRAAACPRAARLRSRMLAACLVRPAPLVVYVATWSGWFATNTGYDRDWAAANGIHTPVIAAIASFLDTRSRSSSSTSG